MPLSSRLFNSLFFSMSVSYLGGESKGAGAKTDEVRI